MRTKRLRTGRIDQNKSTAARRSRLGILPFLVATAAVSALGGGTSRGGRSLWYRALRKPSFNPPRGAFAPVWTALYGLMSWSAYRIWKRRDSSARSRTLRLWGTQLALNGVWSPLFFGARAPRASLVDLAGLGISIVAYMRSAAKVDRVASALMAPYLGWVAFAGVLNAEIVRRNPRLG